ncbi:MAG TPA: hypothetical protein VMQ46_07135 [Acidimicrobiia bacterium]|nr:hypothetical protein [Acidimicrobiia bacterium]
MRRVKRGGIAVLAIIGLFALSGLAMAATDEENDTVFNYGYDEDSQFFMWNVTSLDYEPDQEALAEILFADFDELLEACGLAAGEGEDEIVYGYTFDGESITLHELDSEGIFDPEAEGIDPGDCGELNGGYVTGPNGQVNHGMFMKLFNSLYDGPNRGCVVRHIAQSDLGKDDQQVLADPEFEPEEDPEPIEDGNVSFTTVGADCVHSDTGDDVEGAGNGGRRGPPQHVLDKWGEDGKPGKSGSAPGRP